MARQICGSSGGNKFWGCYAQTQPYWSAQSPTAINTLNKLLVHERHSHPVRKIHDRVVCLIAYMNYPYDYDYATLTQVPPSRPDRNDFGTFQCFHPNQTCIVYDFQRSHRHSIQHNKCSSRPTAAAAAFANPFCLSFEIVSYG